MGFELPQYCVAVKMHASCDFPHRLASKLSNVPLCFFSLPLYIAIYILSPSFSGAHHTVLCR